MAFLTHLLVLSLLAIRTSTSPSSFPRARVEDVERPSSLQNAAMNPIAGYVFNGCNFPLYMASATCKPNSGTAVKKINPGQGYWSEPRAYNDACSQTVKIAKDQSMKPQYQLEYNVRDELVWYNLSHEDGDPLSDFARFIEIRGAGPECKKFYCAPNTDRAQCDWPDKLGVCKVADVMLYLC
ncbi:hypothetical protein BS50DRAFT_619758 [Corynespora cassiicola Philippines]|uniref:Uncharacterized protein n=1 Tax=Corynespora cassiicola Philippines TaxID=1448308 RepID=A0A2T2NUG9_CORCC|nr:hypothetical protein BS50DRAFT_619758 [Corynespora cassiicola Philippines]